MTEPTKRPLSVLVVEDHQAIALLIVTVMGMAGHRTSVVASDFAALLAPERWRDVDVLICDINLEDDTVTGCDVVAYVAREAPHVRRVVLSGMPLALLGPMVPDAHVVLHKPSEINTILAAVEG